MYRVSQLSSGLILALTAALQVSGAPSINVDLKAAFPRGPYLLELLETAASENATSYFPLLDKVASGYFSSAATDSELYKHFTQVLQDDGHVSTPEALSTFNLALSLRAAAPRIEAHYQYYLAAIKPAIEEHGEADGCLDWILFNNKQYCSPSLEDEGKSLILSAPLKNLPFDRVLGVGKEAVLYADPTSPTFGSFHQLLSVAAQKGQLSYRLRYRRSTGLSSSNIPVSGYGVQLALKRTDYIVIDDREGEQPSTKESSSDDINLDEEEEVSDLKPLSTSELASLGMKAASYILQSETPFETLVKLTQDFPKFTSSIASHPISEDFAKEQASNIENMVPAGINFLWMNGVQLIERQIEPFTLIDMIRRERKLIDGVRSLGFNGKQAVSLLGHQQVANAKAEDENVRYDWTDRLEDGRALIWLNNLETDKQYEEFPTAIVALLQRSYPGQLPQVGLNIFHLVVPIDFTNVDDLAVAFQLASFVERGVPVRFGFVPLTSSPEAIAQAKIAYYIFENYGVSALIAYLKEVEARSLTTADENAFNKAIEGRELEPESEKLLFAAIFEDESYSQQIKLARHWTTRLGADTPVRPAFANGFAIPREKAWMQTMSMKFSQDLQLVQQSIFHGIIKDGMWIPNTFLEKAMARRNSYIVPEEDTSLRILDINKVYTEHYDLLTQVPVLEASSESTNENWAVLTVVADLDVDDGLELLLSALAFKRASPGVRLDIVHNPSTTSSSFDIIAKLKASQEKLGNVESLDELKSLIETSNDVSGGDYAASLANFLTTSRLLPGTHYVTLNGRVVGPIIASNPFQEDDFQQLLKFEQTARIKPVYAAVSDLGLTEKLTDPVVAAKLTSITALSTVSDLPQGIFESAPDIRSTLYNTWGSEHTTIEVGNPETASVHIAGLLNPASEQGQRWAPILKVLSELDGVYLKLFINPHGKTEELPIKRFFRYVLDSKPSFDEAGNAKGSNATFKGLPSEALLTVAMDVPPAWLVAPKASVHDLDNIKLSSVKNDIDATYELEHILIEGHSREGRRAPPRGAQLVLATDDGTHLTDTIVMANLGYFQFQANPGFYNIQMKEGRSADIFTIESVGDQGYQAVPGDEGTDVALMDFQGTTLYPRLQRKPGMEKADVLEEDDSASAGSNNIISKGLKFAESLVGGRGSNSKSKSLSAQTHADINIFSVASGHLYERMLNSMILSVMRHTKHTVKFWFIEQFLSPSFKDFIPHLAAAYGFQYQMVTYKWPHWLRQQTEKQREIWGYKILFLDVLFPLSLDKVIFVDADQVVRTDMMDLVNLDLEGAPYGFTPMCDSRTEMEGFRFWKQGYWANYLRGKPYHISALYVVDLHRFRAIAAGDRLRQQYHALSADPNSLSNLDQDLPNHMQFNIPIFSLPQEWLWCETWCSDDSQKDAKTIDLCNNPQTKEPKLDRARRQVPEWSVYDEEIAAVDRKRRGVSEEVESAIKVEKNTKSRRLEEEPQHTKDEL